MRNSKDFKQVKPFRTSNMIQEGSTESNENLVILHVSTPKSWRGGEQQIAYLYEELERKNVTQYLLCNSEGELYTRAKKKGWNVIPCGKRSGFDVAFAYQIKHSCSSLGITHVHVHDSQAHTLSLISALLFRNKVPVVLSRKVDFPVGNSFLSRFKYNHSSIAKIICVSDAIKNIMAQSVTAKNKLCTVMDGIDLQRFRDLTAGPFLRSTYGVPKEHALVGNVSAIAPHKDYYTFVDTVVELEKSSFPATYFIIGDGPEKEKIKAYVSRKGLEDRIHFTGFIPEVLPVLKELDVLLMTSKTEGLGTTILDAFACEVPVVATSAGGIPEIVKHHETGLIGEVGDFKYLAELVEKMLDDKKLQQDICRTAMDSLPKYSVERMATETLEVYKQI